MLTTSARESSSTPVGADRLRFIPGVTRRMSVSDRTIMSSAETENYPVRKKRNPSRLYSSWNKYDLLTSKHSCSIITLSCLLGKHGQKENITSCKKKKIFPVFILPGVNMISWLPPTSRGNLMSLAEHSCMIARLRLLGKHSRRERWLKKTAPKCFANSSHTPVHSSDFFLIIIQILILLSANNGKQLCELSYHGCRVVTTFPYSFFH